MLWDNSESRDNWLNELENCIDYNMISNSITTLEIVFNEILTKLSLEKDNRTNNIYDVIISDFPTDS